MVSEPQDILFAVDVLTPKPLCLRRPIHLMFGAFIQLKKLTQATLDWW